MFGTERGRSGRASMEGTKEFFQNKNRFQLNRIFAADFLLRNQILRNLLPTF